MTFECVETQDKKLSRSSDPGQTRNIRKAFSAAADMQLNQLRAMLRQAVVDYNVLGLSGPSNYTFMAPAARINQFAGWLENAANASLDARWWVHPWINKATQHGLKKAQAEMQGVEYQPIPTTFESLHQMAHDELRGIIGTLVQKVMRTAHSAAAKRLVPHQAFRELVKPIDDDIRHRLQLFTQYIIVKGHVHGKVAYYRQHGITHVGVNPELRRPRLIKHDHRVRDARGNIPEMGWQTAGDDLVCADCEDMAADSPYSLDEILELIPLHPECRCEAVIWQDSEDYEDSIALDAGNPAVEFTQDPHSGRFTGSIGHGVQGEHSQPSHPHDPQLNRHYSVEAYVRNGVIYTPNVYDATRALYEGRNVILKQPKQVSTLVQHLGEVSARMVEMGGKAPNFDLCHVAIKGTNLFCADTRGIPRIKMPQMSKLQTKAFVVHLIKQGYDVEKDTEKASHLRATQNQLVGAKVAANVQRMKDNPKLRDRRIVISKDDYILDGHHKWAALLALDAKNNRLGDLKMRVSRVDIDIITLLKLAHQFTGGKGAKGTGAHDAFEEEQHPRGEHGRWLEKGNEKLNALWQTQLSTTLNKNWAAQAQEKYRVVLKQELDEVAKSVGFSPDFVKVVNEKKSFVLNEESQDTAGVFDPDDGHATIYSSIVDPTFAPLCLSHEIGHAKFHAWYKEYQRETAEAMQNDPPVFKPDGLLREPYASQYPVLQEYTKLVDNNYAALKLQDGITDYSRDWWRAHAMREASIYSAVTETIAEMSMLDFQGKLKDKHPTETWMAVYNAVQNYWDKNKPQGFHHA
jgi:hypothetical protein